MAILDGIDDFDLRLHHRSEMESAGLAKIIEISQTFGVPAIHKRIAELEDIFAEDEKKLRERLDQEVLQDMRNPNDVFNALYNKTSGTRAQDYFLSMLQHMLLIREEGQPLVHYYQLLSSIISEIVLDKKLGGAEQRLGHSVERIISQFNEADRLQQAADEAAEARALAVRLRLEKEALEAELSQGEHGLVGQLKEENAALEGKLVVSRETTQRLQKQLQADRESYEEKIQQLEAQIMELFRMLKEVGKGVDAVLDGGTMDRKALVLSLEKTFQRHKTIGILEGREASLRRKAKGANGLESSFDDDSDPEATPKKPGQESRKGKGGPGGKAPPGIQIDENGRISQFMDADEADAQEQVQQQLAAGIKLVRSLKLVSSLPNIFLVYPDVR